MMQLTNLSNKILNTSKMLDEGNTSRPIYENKDNIKSCRYCKGMKC